MTCQGVIRRHATLLQGAAAYLVAMAGLGVLTVYAVISVLYALERAVASKPSVATAPAAASVRVSLELADDAYDDMLRSEAFWQGQRASNSASSSRAGRQSRLPPKNQLGRRPDSVPPPQQGLFAPWPFGFGTPDSEQERGQSNERSTQRSSRFRTMCVRLCDGYYWPISFSTGEDRFATDAATCANSCTSPARLFVYRNSGEDVDDMRDLSGSPYQKLRTAFLYRTSYDGSCKCRPHSWEQASLDRHRLYALHAKQRKGDNSVASELKDLRQKVGKSKQKQKEELRRLKRSERRGWSTISLAAMPPFPARRGESLAHVPSRVLAAASLAPSASRVSNTPARRPAPNPLREIRNEARDGASNGASNGARASLPSVSSLATVSLVGAQPGPDNRPDSSVVAAKMKHTRMNLGATRRQAVRRPPAKTSRAPRMRPPAEDWRRRVYGGD